MERTQDNVKKAIIGFLEDEFGCRCKLSEQTKFSDLGLEAPEIYAVDKYVADCFGVVISGMALNQVETIGDMIKTVMVA